MSYLSPPYTDDDDARSTSSSSNSSTKGYETKLALKLRSVDPERAARLAARAARNRVSAQKSRDRKKKHVSELEQESNQLRAEKSELEERVRTLEDLVKTLLMNQNLSPTNQPSSLSSIAAPREDVLLPADLLSKSEFQSSENTAKPFIQQSSHQHQSTNESHACLPAEEVTFNRHGCYHERSNAPQRAWISAWLIMSAKALTVLDDCQTDSVKENLMALQHTLKSAAASTQTKDYSLRIRRRNRFRQRLRIYSKRHSVLHHRHNQRSIPCH